MMLTWHRHSQEMDMFVSPNQPLNLPSPFPITLKRCCKFPTASKGLVRWEDDMLDGFLFANDLRGRRVRASKSPNGNKRILRPVGRSKSFAIHVRSTFIAPEEPQMVKNYNFIVPTSSSRAILFVILALFLLLEPSLGIVCRKERVGPLGLNDFRGGMNVDCGQYVQHCLKVQMWDGTVIRDCDPLALCPKDGNKLISRAEYFCCLGDLCNGEGRAWNFNTTLAMLSTIFGLFFVYHFWWS